jgi:hypothetical protein
MATAAVTAKRPRRTRTQPATPPRLLTRTYMLAPADQDALETLARAASEEIRWTISGSAMLRALIRHASSQNVNWARAHLHPLIEAEIGTGLAWGKKGKKASA